MADPTPRTIVLATGNPGKLREIRQVLSGLGVDVLSRVDDAGHHAPFADVFHHITSQVRLNLVPHECASYNMCDDLPQFQCPDRFLESRGHPEVF